ncbi:hypothetical protein Ctha_0135 [Chloroherpeton thalassium ATCC 35110]|uniref:Uncharacterized protein n=1 Tax=Chloroherpeton thalassium (strain ATCC 35110 / GB-78) TaxID=517418 RepID=B3QSW3_CHLT3|nr:hypothetical protein [Chloroherpeton thalassium]ACF12606.1 hypothetical protein Ctha_0135 [Chloroherpeton thalassium ATCC 35110]
MSACFVSLPFFFVSLSGDEGLLFQEAVFRLRSTRHGFSSSFSCQPVFFHVSLLCQPAMFLVSLSGDEGLLFQEAVFLVSLSGDEGLPF